MTKKRILIVENQGFTAFLERDALLGLGYEVSGIVMTGEDAVRHANEKKLDAVLMDINLSGEMDGREAARKIRAAHKIPVIYVTTFGDKETSKSGNFTVPEGFGYIVKPFTKDELRTEIERLTG